MYAALRDDGALREAARGAGLRPEPTWTRAKVIDELLSVFVEPRLIQPTFLIDYPVELAPLAKRKRDDPDTVERFECFIGGMEIGNAFSELNDPVDQRARFEAQVEARQAGDDEAQPMDEDFLEALEHAISVVGIDHVGYGSDHVVEPNGYPTWVRAYLSEKYNPYSPQRGPRMKSLADVLKDVELAPDEQLEGFHGIQDLPRLTDALLTRGYSEEDVQKVLGGNFMRLFRQVWGA